MTHHCVREDAPAALFHQVVPHEAHPVPLVGLQRRRQAPGNRHLAGCQVPGGVAPARGARTRRAAVLLVITVHHRLLRRVRPRAAARRGEQRHRR